MMIQVKYRDGIMDMIQTYMLQSMIATNKVVQFKRSSGWVTVGIDPLRGPKTNEHLGHERRAFMFGL